jgi:hypothetical protein
MSAVSDVLERRGFFFAAWAALCAARFSPGANVTARHLAGKVQIHGYS